MQQQLKKGTDCCSHSVADSNALTLAHTAPAGELSLVCAFSTCASPTPRSCSALRITCVQNTPQQRLKLCFIDGNRVQPEMYHPVQTALSEPLKSLKVGTELQVAVIGTYSSASVHRASRHVLELSARASTLDAARAGSIPMPAATYNSLHVGQRIAGVVQRVAKDHLFVSLASAVRGRVSALQAVSMPEDVSRLQKRFRVGTRAAALVVAVDAELQRLDLSLLGDSFAHFEHGAPQPVVRSLPRRFCWQCAAIVGLSSSFVNVGP
jgi:hypothetical protein